MSICFFEAAVCSGFDSPYVMEALVESVLWKGILKINNMSVFSLSGWFILWVADRPTRSNKAHSNVSQQVQAFKGMTNEALIFLVPFETRCLSNEMRFFPHHMFFHAISAISIIRLTGCVIECKTRLFWLKLKKSNEPETKTKCMKLSRAQQNVMSHIIGHFIRNPPLVSPCWCVVKDCSSSVDPQRMFSPSWEVSVCPQSYTLMDIFDWGPL